MPIELAALVSLAAGAAVKAAVGGAATGLAKGAARKIGRALSDDGPLEKPLRKAYAQAFTAFFKFLDESFAFTYSNEQGLNTLPETEAFRSIVGQLPYKPFHDVDTGPLREAFLAIGIQGATPADFDAAWQALGRRFERAVAQENELKSFVELAQARKTVELLERLVALQETAAKAPDHAPAIQQYCEALFRQYRYADTRGLFMREREGVGEGIELRDVFVETPLAPLREEKDKEKKRDPEKRKAASWRDEEAEEPSETRAEPVRIGDLLARERLIVVLGPPGCGKSTLLRCLALTLCGPEGAEPIVEHRLPPDTVPVLLPLKEFASALRDDAGLRLDEFFFGRFGKELPGLEPLLLDGRALVLFDGLDEVFDESHRLWVSEEVWRFTSRFPQARFVLTSRPRGYEAAPLPGPVPRWRLLPFDDEQIGRFFRGWFEALAREGAEAGADEPPERRAAALTQEVLARPRLKEMAQNPLLCTLIVLVGRSRSGRLPERRVVFYEAAVKTLAESWERTKRAPRQDDREKLEFPEPEILIRALAEVAWRAFHQLASREIPGSELRAWLREYLEREPEWRGEKGERAVRDLLKLVGERTGLLVDLGGDRYQFAHLSLHEWLVSSFLLDRLREEDRWKIVRHYLHAPEWEEVLRLLVGGAPQAQADFLIANVLDEPSSEWEDRLQRDLRFIARCVGDQAPVGPGTRARIVARAVQALDEPDLLDIEGFLQDIAGIGPAPEFAARLWPRLQHPNPRSHSLAVDYFARVGVADEETRRAFLASLGDENWAVRSSAVNYFARVEAADEETRRAVLERLGDESGAVRRSVADYFARVGAADEETRRAFLGSLGDKNWAVRSSVVDFFARVGAADEETRRAFLASLGDENWAVRSSAVDYFARVGVADEETRRAVLERLGDEIGAVRRSVVDYFARVRAADEETRRAFLESLGDEIGAVRSSAVNYFARVGAANEETRRAFLESLGDENWAVRSSAVDYFARVGAADEETRRAVLERLGDENWPVCRSAVGYFTRVGAADEETRRAILERLGDEDEDVRSSAVNYFVRVGAADEETRRAILEKLGDKDVLVRSSAVEYFTRIDFADEKVRRTILSQLQKADDVFQLAAFRYLLKTGFSRELVDTLLELYLSVSESTSPEEDRRFSEEIGKLMALDEALRDRILGGESPISNFQLPAALPACALEHDRLRRQDNPLTLDGVPGCAAA